MKTRFIKTQKLLRKNVQVYDRKKEDLNKRLEAEFIDHGVATIPCKVSGIDDIISPYSVTKYERLNSDFVEFISDDAELIPAEYPIVLSIVGCEFTKDEQETIKKTIEDDFAYHLCTVEEENKYHLKVFWWMAAGILLSGILLTIFDFWSTVPMELLFVIFWFFADTFFDYLFLEGRQLRKKHIKAAQLVCMKVEFSEEYDDQDYSEEEAKEVFDEISHKA